MNKPNIFFATDPAKLFLPWMSMLMSFIAVLILAAGMLTYTSVTRWQRSVSGSLTVQIPTYTELGAARGELVDKDIETALTILRVSDGILGATVLSDNQMADLMTPWLGDNAVMAELPLPKLIDVTVDPTAQLDLAQIQADLADQVPAATLDSHRIWLTPLLRLSSGIIKLIGFILLLLVLTTSFTVIYATRTSLSVHEPVISLVHMMGANDFYVTNQYANRSFRLTLAGALFGFGLALPIMAGASFFLRGVSSELVIQPTLTLMQWGTLITIPFVLSFLAFITTFKTVLAYLKRFL